jgi:hypothetical protein
LPVSLAPHHKGVNGSKCSTERIIYVGFRWKWVVSSTSPLHHGLTRLGVRWSRQPNRTGQNIEKFSLFRESNPKHQVHSQPFLLASASYCTTLSEFTSMLCIIKDCFLQLYNFTHQNHFF